MTLLRASAPGKIVIAGEYAVLDGAPAISMAVDRRARVSIDPGRRPAVRTIGPAADGDRRILDAVLRATGAVEPDALIELDTSEFVDGSGTKLGIGSSAALAAALTTAVSDAALTAGERLAPALEAHRYFQGDHGSGVDVATSITGGLVLYRRQHPPERLEWPAGLTSAILSSGVAADTRQKVSGLTADRNFTAAGRAAADAAAAWRDGNARAILDSMRSWVEALAAIDVEYGIGIYAAGHDKLAKRAAGSGLVYKPCGAGGGDTGIVLGTDPDAVDRFASAAGRAGFERLDVKLDERGASREGALP